MGQSEPPAIAVASRAAGTSNKDLSGSRPENPDIPPAMQDLMRMAQRRYLEGSNLIKSGESAKARAEFNRAVDMLLESEWDLTSVPVLNRFFQDLIRRIQQDESRYLQPPAFTQEQPESAVVDELSKLDLIPIKIDPSLTDVVEADLANTKYDIPITLNEQVLKSLNYWLNKGHKYFVDGLRRSGRYRDMIERIFREESIPLDLMYLAQVESLFKPNALSRARAKGIWQFTRWTAIRYGLKVNSYVDERSDPEKSTRAAAHYLNDLYAMFKDWNLVVAAYNWGEANVQRLMDKSGLNDFWEMLAWRRRTFPKETKNHVPLVMASVILARNPEKYGFPKVLEQTETYDRVPVSKPIDLREAARILNTSLEELKLLNPALRSLCTPADYPDFVLKVPPGSDPEIAQKLAALPAVKFRPPTDLSGRYKVQPGDTLSRIAARFHVPAASLQEVNDIRSPKSLRAGTWLQVPGSRSSTARSVSAGTKTGSSRIPTNRISSSVKSGTAQKGTSAKSPGIKPSASKAKASKKLSTASVGKESKPAP